MNIKTVRILTAAILMTAMLAGWAAVDPRHGAGAPIGTVATVVANQLNFQPSATWVSAYNAGTADVLVQVNCTTSTAYGVAFDTNTAVVVPAGMRVTFDRKDLPYGSVCWVAISGTNNFYIAAH